MANAHTYIHIWLCAYVKLCIGAFANIWHGCLSGHLLIFRSLLNDRPKCKKCKKFKFGIFNSRFLLSIYVLIVKAYNIVRSEKLRRTNYALSVS